MSKEPCEEFITAEDYAEFLRFGNEEGTRSSNIPGEFIKDEDGTIWFVSGGSQCVGSAFCHWHSGMDAVYAVGSSTIANVGIPSHILRDAVDLLEAIDPTKLDSPYDDVERLWLIELGKAALDAEPSEEMQQVYE